MRPAAFSCIHHAIHAWRDCPRTVAPSCSGNSTFGRSNGCRELRSARLSIKRCDIDILWLLSPHAAPLHWIIGEKAARHIGLHLRRRIVEGQLDCEQIVFTHGKSSCSSLIQKMAGDVSAIARM
eukprot:2986278-Pleurochrysis_carterae.AAC.2